MFRKPRNAVIGCLVLALVVGYFVTGHYLYKAWIGLDANAFLAGEALHKLALAVDPGVKSKVVGVILGLLSALFTAGVVFFLVRGAVRHQVAAVDPSRRRFLTGAGTGAGAALISLIVAAGAAAARGLFGLGQGHGGWMGVRKHIGDETVVRTHPEWKQTWKGSRIRSHRRLGRTGWEVSDIVLGTGRIRGEDGERIARSAIDRGVNYFDTSPDYSAAGSEQAMGRAIKGVRDRLFIATKFCMPSGHLAAGTPVAGYEKAVEDSLRRLGTDYVDLCHIHACDEVERLMDPNAHEAFDRLKQEGKVRFLGFSSHSPNLVQVANRRYDAGLPSRGLGADGRDHLARAPRAGHGRGGDEDAQGGEAPRPGRLSRAGGRLFPGGTALDTLEPRRLMRGDLLLRAPARRRVPPRLGQHARAPRPRDPREVRSRDPRQLLLAALRRVPGFVQRGAADQRRAPLSHVLRELRLGEGGDAALLPAEQERVGMHRVLGSLSRQLSGRNSDPGALARRPRAADARLRGDVVKCLNPCAEILPGVRC
jgi:hypothetical protein